MASFVNTDMNKNCSKSIIVIIVEKCKRFFLFVGFLCLFDHTCAATRPTRYNNKKAPAIISMTDDSFVTCGIYPTKKVPRSGDR